MGQVALHPWYLVTCVLGAANFYTGTSANVAFPPGLAPGIHNNNTLTHRMHLEIAKQTILKALARRKADVEVDVVKETNSGPAEPTGGSISRPNFVYSKSPGKNLLLFNINRNSTALQEGQVTRVNLWVHVWLKEEKKKKKKKKQMRRRRSRIIRINVYKSNSSNSEDFVATLQTRIQSTNWFRIGLPITLIQDLKESKNNTITLRVECKRCNRRTRLMLPTKSKNKCKKNKRKRKKKRRNNKKRPNRKLKALRNTKRGCGTARSYPASSPRFPFMVIEQRYDSSDRRKRSVTCNPADLNYRNGTVNSRRCCRMSTYVDFSDIDLDDYIVTPAGYQASSCVGRCPRLHRNRNRSSRRRNRGRARNRNERPGDRKRRGKCRAVQTSPLTVWLFDSEHNLVQAHLPDLVVRNCDCR